MKTRDKIVLTSIDLFNREGVVAITTNHIAKALNISPGNLYFHFANKEEIIREIFKLMKTEYQQLWMLKKGQKVPHPLELIEKNYELFWKYRFFYREMYYLKRKDVVLFNTYKTYFSKLQKLMTVMYKRWLKQGMMKPIESKDEIEFLVTTIFATASSFLNFFESAEKLPSKENIDKGKVYVARLLTHYTQGAVQEDFKQYVSGK